MQVVTWCRRLRSMPPDELALHRWPDWALPVLFCKTTLESDQHHRLTCIEEWACGIGGDSGWLIAWIPLLFGEILENLGKSRETQWNSVWFCMALNMKGIPEKFRGNARFSGNIWDWGGFGWFGVSKGLCANSQSEILRAAEVPRKFPRLPWKFPGSNWTFSRVKTLFWEAWHPLMTHKKVRPKNVNMLASFYSPGGHSGQNVWKGALIPK